MEIKKTQNLLKNMFWRLIFNFFSILHAFQTICKIFYILTFLTFLTSKGSQGQLQKNDLLMMLSLNMVDKASKVEFRQSLQMCMKKLFYQKCDYLWTRL